MLQLHTYIQTLQYRPYLNGIIKTKSFPYYSHGLEWKKINIDYEEQESLVLSVLSCWFRGFSWKFREEEKEYLRLQIVLMRFWGFPNLPPHPTFLLREGRFSGDFIWAESNGMSEWASWNSPPAFNYLFVCLFSWRAFFHVIFSFCVFTKKEKQKQKLALDTDWAN